MKCDICGPYFIGICKHKMSAKEMVEEVLSWRSDDFGHDCQALLEAESRALQDVGEKYLSLDEQLAAAQKEIEELRALLKECERVTESCLANFACDWYVEMMSKDTTPNGMSTGIAAQVHNRDVAKRFMIALEEQRDLLQKLKRLRGE